ncbi:MAG TPA: hypothetical protein VFH03_06565, partial [Actinoplanes sp.]|nr:hypothetical protein [Actinoplanes sp.]
MGTHGPAFIGLAPSDELGRYLADVPRSTVRSVDIGTGALPVSTQRISGSRAPEAVPGNQPFWLRSGTGQLDWIPSHLENNRYSLVVMNPGAQPGLQLQSTAEVRPGWLNSATWALLFLGTLTVMAGMIILAWPGRRREVVYVVEPSQVPDLMKAIGAPIPLSRTGGGRHAGTHRPRTLADAASRPPSLPQFSWPPAAASQPAPVAPAAASSAASPSAALAGAAASASAGSPSAGLSGALASASSPPSSHSSSFPSSPSSSTSPFSAPAGPGVASGTSPSVGAAGPPSPEAYFAATAIPAGTGAAPHRPPAPGEPLNLLTGTNRPASGQSPSAGLVGVPGPAATGTDPLFGPVGEPPGKPGERAPRRRTPTTATDTPVFEATAVGAWVAETAAARARETEARAAAALAQTRKADTNPGARTETAEAAKAADALKAEEAAKVADAVNGDGAAKVADAVKAEEVAKAADALQADEAAKAKAAAAQAIGAAAQIRARAAGASDATAAKAAGAPDAATPARSAHPAKSTGAPQSSKPTADRPSTVAAGWVPTGLTRADSRRVGLTIPAAGPAPTSPQADSKPEVVPANASAPPTSAPSGSAPAPAPAPPRPTQPRPTGPSPARPTSPARPPTPA